MTLGIASLVGVALVMVVLLAVVRQSRPELGIQLGIASAATIFLILLPQIALAVRLLETVALKAHIELRFLDVVLRVIGIAYLAEFGAQVARDAGEGALAQKLELGGKILILVLAIPVVNALLQLVLGMLRPGAL